MDESPFIMTPRTCVEGVAPPEFRRGRGNFTTKNKNRKTFKYVVCACELFVYKSRFFIVVVFVIPKKLNRSINSIIKAFKSRSFFF